MMMYVTSSLHCIAQPAIVWKVVLLFKRPNSSSPSLSVERTDWFAIALEPGLQFKLGIGKLGTSHVIELCLPPSLIMNYAVYRCGKVCKSAAFGGL